MGTETIGTEIETETKLMDNLCEELGLEHYSTVAKERTELDAMHHMLIALAYHVRSLQTQSPAPVAKPTDLGKYEAWLALITSTDPRQLRESLAVTFRNVFYQFAGEILLYGKQKNNQPDHTIQILIANKVAEIIKNVNPYLPVIE